MGSENAEIRQYENAPLWYQTSNTTLQPLGASKAPSGRVTVRRWRRIVGGSIDFKPQAITARVLGDKMFIETCFSSWPHRFSMSSAIGGDHDRDCWISVLLVLRCPGRNAKPLWPSWQSILFVSGSSLVRFPLRDLKAPSGRATVRRWRRIVAGPTDFKPHMNNYDSGGPG